MRYIIIFYLLMGISYADTSLEQEYVNIDKKFSKKESELIQWNSYSIEKINLDSLNKINFFFFKILDEENRIEKLMMQRSDINIKNERKAFIRYSDLGRFNREHQRIDIYYDRYPNEFAIICRGIIKDGQIKVNGNKETIVLATAASFEFLSSSKALYTYVTGPLFEVERFNKKYPGKRNVIFQNELKFKKSIDEFKFYMNNEILFKINRNNGEVWGGFRKNVLFESNECYETNRLAAELKLDRYKELFKLQELIVNSINKKLSNKLVRKSDDISGKISNIRRSIEQLENKIAFLHEENELSIKKQKNFYKTKLDELRNNKEKEKYNLWYNSPDQIAKREKERKKKAASASNQNEYILNKISIAKSCYLRNPDSRLRDIYSEMMLMTRKYGLSGLNKNTNATYLGIAEARANQLISFLGCQT